MNALICRFFDFFSTFNHPFRVAVTDFLLITPMMIGGTYYTLYWQAANAPYGVVYHTSHWRVLAVTISATLVMAVLSHGSATRARLLHSIRLPWRTAWTSVGVVLAFTALTVAVKVLVLHRELTVYEVSLSLCMFGLSGAPLGYRWLGFRAPQHTPSSAAVPCSPQ